MLFFYVRLSNFCPACLISHAESCTLLNGVGKSSRKRRATASSCEDCLAMTLTDQVFPPGTISSVEALNVSSFPIRRNDPEFQK